MKDETSTKSMGKAGPNKGHSGYKRGEINVLEGLKPTPPVASGETPKPQVADQRARSNQELPTEEKEPLPQALAFFMLELQLGLGTINKLNEAAYAEFDRITADEVMSKNTIEAGELLEMHVFLELLSRELQVVGQKAQTIVGRFRNSLLDAGVDAAELEERTNKKKQDWPSDSGERLKQVMAKLSEKQMDIRTQIMLTLTALCKLHEILESVRDGHGPFDRIDRQSLLLAREIVKTLKNLDGGDVWKILRA